jgi:threonine dehydratase
VPVAADDVETAVERTSGYVRSTPVLEVEPGVLGASDRVVVKLEQLQHTGSFKPRGAFNRMLSERVPRAGVVAASGGNFGAAVAYAASVLGHAAELFVPESTPTTKVDRLRALRRRRRCHRRVLRRRARGGRAALPRDASRSR